MYKLFVFVGAGVILAIVVSLAVFFHGQMRMATAQKIASQEHIIILPISSIPE